MMKYIIGLLIVFVVSILLMQHGIRTGRYLQAQEYKAMGLDPDKYNLALKARTACELRLREYEIEEESK